MAMEPASKRVKTALLPGEGKSGFERDMVAPFLRVAVLMADMCDANLRLAAQAGATDIVAPYLGKDPSTLEELQARVGGFGLKICAIERLVPHDEIVHNKSAAGRDEQIEDIKALIRNMGRLGIPIMCYNWMPLDDWSRTNVEVAERGGAKVTEFNVLAEDATLDAGAADYRKGVDKVTSPEELWANLEYFLKQVVPVAEECGVALALHPDDPPMPNFRGVPQIMYNSDALVRAAQLVKSKANGICLCQGTFASAGEDVPAAIRKCAPYIKYSHFRDVVGSVPHFIETFHDNGKTDMYECIKAYYECGLRDIPIRPDHAPVLEGEANAHPGYEPLGRLYALGYMRGLMEAVQRAAAKSS